MWGGRCRWTPIDAQRAPAYACRRPASASSLRVPVRPEAQSAWVRGPLDRWSGDFSLRPPHESAAARTDSTATRCQCGQDARVPSPAARTDSTATRCQCGQDARREKTTDGDPHAAAGGEGQRERAVARRTATQTRRISPADSVLPWRPKRPCRRTPPRYHESAPHPWLALPPRSPCRESEPAQSEGPALASP